MESWAMGWPMILIMFFQSSIGITDAYVAGYLGTDIFAAVGYVGQLYWALIILANAIAVGTVSMISQAYGAKSEEAIATVTSHSMLMALIIAGLLTVGARLYPESIVRIAGMPEDIREVAREFIRIFSLVLIPTYLMIISASVLRASGRVRVSMINTIIASVVNVVLDIILSFGWDPIPALGFRGIAWATASATSLGMLLNMAHLVFGSGRIRMSSLANVRMRCMRNLIRLGGPSALQQTAWNAGTLMVYFMVGQLQGGQVTALAAMTGGGKIEAIIFLPVFALNMASAVLTGNRLGAGDVDGARSGAKATAFMSLLIILAPTLLIFVLAPSISGLFTKDAAVLAEMTRYLRVNMLGMPFFAVAVTLSGALQGAGDTIATMRIIFTGMWLFRIPLILAVIHVFKTQALGVWCAMTVSMVLMCGLLMHRFHGGAWMKASIDKKNNSMLWEACAGKKRDEVPL